VPWLTAAILLANGLYITRLPDAEHDTTPAPAAERAISSGALRNRGFLLLNVCDGVLGTNQVLLNVVIPLWLVEQTDAPRVLLAWLFGTNTVLAVLLQVAASRGSETVPGALRNRGFVALFTCDGVLSTNQVLLNVVIPLWLVEETDAPRVLLAWLFGTNTVLAVLLQVAAARGVVSVADSLRALRRGAAFFVLSCGIVAVTHDTVGWVTVVLVWVGHVTVTGAELFDSAGEWGLQAELSDPARRGEYQGVSQLGYTLGSVWAPAVYTFLAMEWGGPGWLVIAAIVVVAAIAAHPTAHAAERHLESLAEPALAE